MEATVADVETTPPSPPKDYTSRPGALIWCFRKSRDGWKRKYQDLKATVKADKNRIADLAKSRDQWRKKAEHVGAQLFALEAEIAGLRAGIGACEEKKRTTVPVR
jgi:septal ring factor EnvC (AmiA/AmiB activator)